MRLQRPDFLRRILVDPMHRRLSRDAVSGQPLPDQLVVEDVVGGARAALHSDLHGDGWIPSEHRDHAARLRLLDFAAGEGNLLADGVAVAQVRQVNAHLADGVVAASAAAPWHRLLHEVRDGVVMVEDVKVQPLKVDRFGHREIECLIPCGAEIVGDGASPVDEHRLGVHGLTLNHTIGVALPEKVRTGKSSSSSYHAGDEHDLVLRPQSRKLRPPLLVGIALQ
mmetsp:Transcript_12717/g.32040  ORF Transcript_12717/g.32040 Transcript_12717/m.32040 type:complete len:224 (-) Transcript_12717:592-1263(-)